MLKKNRLITIFFLIIMPTFGMNNTYAQTVSENQEDIFLATISTDYIKKSYDLILTLNERKLIAAIKTKDSKKNKVKTYPVSVLNKPITLVKAVGVTLVNLSCLNFATNRGCDIIIEYPSNITVGKFKKFTAKLEKHEGTWKLTKSGNPFSQMNLISRKIVGLLIGIKRIDIL